MFPLLIAPVSSSSPAEPAPIYCKTSRHRGFAIASADIYCLFYEKGIELLGELGSLTFITSNKWMRAGYGKRLRKFLSEDVNPRLILDFAGEKVFESASVDTNILLAVRGVNNGETLACSATNTIKLDIAAYVSSHSMVVSYRTDGIWLITSPLVRSIEEKIRAIGTPLGELGVQINRGVLTGFNDAFIVDSATRESILAECGSTEERMRTDKLLRPLLRGRNIKYKKFDWRGEYLVATHNGVPERGIPRINVEDYPAVKRHLEKFHQQLFARGDKGDTPYNLRACAYIEDFDKPKLIYPETTQGAFFALDDGSMWLDKTCFMIVSDKAAFLQRILSSKLFEFAYRKIFASVGLGGRGYQYNKHALLRLPIPREDDVGRVMGLGTEREIDDEMYKVYGLTQEEISIVEDDMKDRS